MTRTRTGSAAGEAWMLMHRLMSSERQRFMAIAAEFDLSPGQAAALQRLEPGEPVAMGRLAAALRCDNSNVTGLVDRLEERGLVERQTGERDRRVKQLAVTERGAAVREQLRKRMWEAPGALGSLSAGDQRTLRDIL